MNNNSNEQTSIVPAPPTTIQTDPSAKPVKLSELLKDYGLDAPRIAAQDLVGEEFIILRARAFQSRFSGQAHAWFCVCILEKGGDVFTTILGGAACVDILDAWAATGHVEPLVVKLEWVEGGAYKGYYRLT